MRPSAFKQGILTTYQHQSCKSAKLSCLLGCSFTRAHHFSPSFSLLQSPGGSVSAHAVSTQWQSLMETLPAACGLHPSCRPLCHLWNSFLSSSLSFLKISQTGFSSLKFLLSLLADLKSYLNLLPGCWIYCTFLIFLFMSSLIYIFSPVLQVQIRLITGSLKKLCEKQV